MNSNETIIAIAISSFFSLIIAFLTATIKTRAELKHEQVKREMEISEQQKYNYFLPFKYLADEFSGRLRHITRRLSENGTKHDNMVKRFKIDIENHKLDWYYDDNVETSGGYFFIATLYLNLMLFYWIKLIQDRYPYIPLRISNGAKDKLEIHNKIASEQNFISEIPEACEIQNFIKNIKMFLGAEDGIPYGLHDSYGDFMMNYSTGNRMNYDEFCKLLMDDFSRIKFKPVIKFWQNLINVDGIPNQTKIKKLINLTNLLDILVASDIRNVG